MESIKGMKELFLGVFLAFNKLNIVNQNQISGPISISESLHTILANSLN